MLDSNGSNTTAAAGVAKLMTSGDVKGKKAVILAGTGPVGQRAAVMLAKEGVSEVVLVSRKIDRAQQACEDMKKSFDVELIPAEATDCDTNGKLIEDAQIVFATGAAGIELIKPEHWEKNENIELIADANATPPLGIGGTDMMDKGKERHGKIVWGAIGFGTLKLAVHKACVEKLFEKNDQLFDAEEIFDIAKSMS